jgi:hypothetical protein
MFLHIYVPIYLLPQYKFPQNCIGIICYVHSLIGLKDIHVSKRDVDDQFHDLFNSNQQIMPEGDDLNRLRNEACYIMMNIPASAMSSQRAPRELPESSQRALSLPAKYSSFELLENVHILLIFSLKCNCFDTYSSLSSL